MTSPFFSLLESGSDLPWHSEIDKQQGDDGRENDRGEEESPKTDATVPSRESRYETQRQVGKYKFKRHCGLTHAPAFSSDFMAAAIL